MGTRNMTIVKLRGEIKVAQYGQWDGYPNGQGKVIAEFVQKNLLSFNTLKAFVERVAALEWASDQERADAWIKCGGSEEGMPFGEPSKKLARRFPAFTRDTCAKILHAVASGKATRVLNEIECRKHVPYTYVVDLDNRIVEIHGVKRHALKYSFEEFTPKAMDDLQEKSDADSERSYKRRIAREAKEKAKQDAEKQAKLVAVSKTLGVEGRTYRGLPLYKTAYGWNCNGVDMWELPDLKLVVTAMLKRGVTEDVARWDVRNLRTVQAQEKRAAKEARKAARKLARMSA